MADGARCTWFLPAPEGRSARKRWIAGSLSPLGALTVDAGAARALRAAAAPCCRPACAAVDGDFERGDAVLVLAAGRRPSWRAASPPMPARTPRRITGHRSEEIEAILGWRGRDELIHRDDLVLL